MELNPKQLNVLKLIKHDPVALKELNMAMYNVIFGIYFDDYYKREVQTFTIMLEAGLLDPSASFGAILKEYSITKADLTKERINEIARDLADEAIDSLTTEFLKRSFLNHINNAVFTKGYASQTYIEKTLGIRLDAASHRRMKQLETLRQKYNEITPTYNTEVGF